MKEGIPQPVVDMVVKALLPYVPGLTADTLNEALTSAVAPAGAKRAEEPLRQRLYTAELACNYLHVSTTTLWRLVKAGQIKTVAVRGIRRYDVKELDRFIRQNQG